MNEPVASSSRKTTGMSTRRRDRSSMRSNRRCTGGIDGVGGSLRPDAVAGSTPGAGRSAPGRSCPPGTSLTRHNLPSEVVKHATRRPELGGYQARAEHDNAPGSICSRGRAEAGVRSPLGERRNEAPAERWSAKAMGQARGTHHTDEGLKRVSSLGYSVVPKIFVQGYPEG